MWVYSPYRCLSPSNKSYVDTEEGVTDICGGQRSELASWLQFLHFEMREVPQASPGFSPFGLLYGRHPRRVLDGLREEWEKVPGGPIPLSAYITALKEDLRGTTTLTAGSD